MAPAILLELAGVTKEQYDAVWRDLGTGGRLLPGNTFHIGGPTPDGWWTMDVWESAEAAQRALDTTLGPVLAANNFPQVQPRILEMDRVVRE
jgi:hypothetical protein